MSVKLGVSHWGTKISSGCSRIGFWGRHFCRRGMRQQRDYRKLHNGGPHEISCSTNIIRVMKWRRMEFMGMWHVKGGKRRGTYRTLVENPQGKMYVCIYRIQNVFLRCPTTRLHCFLSSHWPSFRFLSSMAFKAPEEKRKDTTWKTHK